MATKPATTFTHATDANIASGPAISLPTKVVPPTPAQGFVPGNGISARMINWLFNVLGQWVGWLNSGSSAAGEDAHLVETDSTGKASVAGLVAGGTAAAFRAISATANTGAGASTVDISNTSGSALQCSSTGASPTIAAVSTGAGAAISATGDVTVSGNTTLGNAGTDTLTCNAAATFGTTVVANGAISALAGINLSAQTISGTAGSIVSVESVEMQETRWTNANTSLPTVAGRTRWNGTFFSLRDGAGQARSFDEPARGYDATFSTVNAINDTAASCGRRIKATEPVWIEISCRFEGTSAPGTLNYRIEVTGPLGTVDILVDTVRIATANVGYTLHETLVWQPNDDFAETDPQNYTFLVRLGVSAGTLTAKRVAIKASSAAQA